MRSEAPNMSLLNKIMELGQALFFNMSESVLRLPVSVVNVLQVDELGQAWFMVHRPTQHINEFDREFSSRLDLYKKDKPFHLRVSGRASLVTDPEEINNLLHLPFEIRNAASTSMVLVKLKISEISYFPHEQKATSFRWHIPSVKLQSSTFVKTLQYIVKDIIPVFQSH